MGHSRAISLLSAAAAVIFGISVASETFVHDADLALAQVLGPPEAVAEPQAPPTTIHLLVTLGWEGRDLQALNLDVLRAFRAQFSDVSILHLLSPAYLTRAGAGAAADQIRSLIKPKDQLAVTLGGWKSVATAAGVLFRNGPTFWGHTLRDKDCVDDCGLEIPVNIYPEADLDKLAKASVTALEAHGFGHPIGMAVEGWVASPAVLEAGARAGMRYDFSGVAAEMISRRAYLFPLYAWVKGLWPSVKPHTQPFTIPTTGGELTEVPQSLASLDYLSGDDAINLFKEYVDQARQESGKELTFQLELYQETARMTVPMLARTLQGMFAYASKNNVSIVPLTLPGLELPPSATAPLVH